MRRPDASGDLVRSAQRPGSVRAVEARASAKRRRPMAHDLPAIDADGHIVERQSDVRKYLPEPWNRRPTSLWTAGDQPWDTSLFETLGGERNHGAMSPQEELDTWLRIMDESGM